MKESFQGADNKLVMNNTWSCDYSCKFHYHLYPFDVQNCFIHFELPDRNNLRSRVLSITYTGNQDLGKYYLMRLKFCSDNKYGRNGAFVDLSFKRPLTGSLMTMFLPTGMLLLISQMSTTFSGTFLELVIEVNTTLLLVLTT